MAHWVLVAAPALVAVATLALVFVGCTNDYDVFESAPPEKQVELRDLVKDSDKTVAYWRLGEADVSQPAADSKDGHVGTYGADVTLGVPGFVEADPDTAAGFDGSLPNSYVGVPFSLDLNASEFTVFALVEVTGGADGSERAIVSSRDAASGRKGFTLYAGAEGKNQWQAWLGTDGADWVKAVGADIMPGKHVVAMTFDGSMLRLYLDPVDESSDNPTEVPAVGYVPNPAYELRIGAGANEGPALYGFYGTIDEVIVFNVALGYASLEQLGVLAFTHMVKV